MTLLKHAILFQRTGAPKVASPIWLKISKLTRIYAMAEQVILSSDF